MMVLGQTCNGGVMLCATWQQFLITPTNTGGWGYPPVTFYEPAPEPSSGSVSGQAIVSSEADRNKGQFLGSDTGRSGQL